MNRDIDEKIVNDGIEKFIQFSFENEQVEKYELEYINSNLEKGFLEINKSVFDTIINFRYNITGLTTLEDYVKSRENTKEDLVKIFIDIAEIVTKCIFVSKTKFILDKDKIFINVNDNSIKLLFLPLVKEYSMDISKSYINMAVELCEEIFDCGNIKKGSADFLVSLKRKSQEKNITILEFIEFAKSQTRFNFNSNRYGREREILNTSTRNSNTMQRASQSQKNLEQFHENKQIQSKMMKNQNYNGHIENSYNDSSQVIEKQMTGYKMSKIIAAILIQPIFICIVVFLAASVDTIQLIGGLIGIIALDGLIVRLFLAPTKKEVICVQKQQRVETTMLDRETTMIGLEPYLEIDNGKNKGIEYIKSDTYVIGRQAELKSWMDNTNVSREHIEILRDGDEYYIRDLNSKNGTRLNEEKLISWKFEKLNDGDVIELPDLMLTYRI